MAIRFVPNDPKVADVLPPRIQHPSPDLPPDRAGFTYSNAVPEGPYDAGTPGFLFWQCREAALAAVATAAGMGLTPGAGRAPVPRAARCNSSPTPGST